MKIRSILSLCHLLFVLWFGLGSLNAHVVVTSKPLYYIVAPLLNGVDTLKLITGQGQCSHHYHLRPSDIRLIQTAQLVIWSGGLHEPFMKKLVHASQHQLIIFNETDGFAWLSPTHVIRNVHEIVTQLKKIYSKEDMNRVQDNAQKFVETLIHLRHRILSETRNLSRKNVIISYPFLTYFEKEFQLTSSTALIQSQGDILTPESLQRVSTMLKMSNVFGMIQDHHGINSTLDSMVRSSGLRRLTLDPEAIHTPLILNGYEILMENLSQSIVKWLNEESDDV